MTTVNAITALIAKDIRLFFRNQFFAVTTVLGLVAYVAIYFLLPAEANDGLQVAVYLENPAATQVDESFAAFFDYTLFDSPTALETALREDGEYIVGLLISAADAAAMSAGEAATVEALYAPNIPAETRQVYDDLLRLMVNAATPRAAARFALVDESAVVLGNDLLGAPIAVRDRMVPMLLLFILSVEVLGLATLITQEVEKGTARALLTSPLRLPHFLAAKALMGLLLAFVQLLLLVAITGKITTAPLLLTATLLLGSFLIVGVGFLIAAISRDSMAVLAWGMLVIVLFAIPAIAVLLPGLASAWIELIPSYFLVDALHRILHFGAGWGEVGGTLLALLVSGAALLLLGSALLRRRFI